jgi:hypothetical protein
MLAIMHGLTSVSCFYEYSGQLASVGRANVIFDAAWVQKVGRITFCGDRLALRDDCKSGLVVAAQCVGLLGLSGRNDGVKCIKSVVHFRRAPVLHSVVTTTLGKKHTHV